MSRKNKNRRHGAVAVEFAIVAPVLVALVMGVTQINQLIEAQNLLESAAREGARFGAMDRTGIVGEGASSNDKLVQDIRNFLAAQGLPAEDVTVEIKHAGTDNDFDLNDPENNLELFEVRVKMPYSSIRNHQIPPEDDYLLEASVTFRNARAIISD